MEKKNHSTFGNVVRGKGKPFWSSDTAEVEDMTWVTANPHCPTCKGAGMFPNSDVCECVENQLDGDLDWTRYTEIEIDPNADYWTVGFEGDGPQLADNVA